MWQKKETKLEPAASMVHQTMPVFRQKEQVILLFDSWYVKENLTDVMNEFSNLDIICCARTDSVLYDLPSKPTSRRGILAKHGKHLAIKEDFILSPEKSMVTIPVHNVY